MSKISKLDLSISRIDGLKLYNQLNKETKEIIEDNTENNYLNVPSISDIYESVKDNDHIQNNTGILTNTELDNNNDNNDNNNEPHDESNINVMKQFNIFTKTGKNPIKHNKLTKKLNNGRTMSHLLEIINKHASEYPK